MAVTFYLWRSDGELSPRRTAAVEVDGAHFHIAESSEPELPEILEGLKAYQELPLRTEEVEQTSDGPRMRQVERRVTPADDGYPFAVGQVTGRVCGCMVTFTPEP